MEGTLHPSCWLSELSITTTTTVKRVILHDNPGKPAPTVLYIDEARDGEVFVASVAPYANYLHLTPDISMPAPCH